MLALTVALGLIIGSFLNVVVARVPERRSLWRPRSACPGCGAVIAWHDNIPVVSFIALRGRCRACGIAIPRRYLVIEIVTAALFAVAHAVFGPTVSLVPALVLLSALIAVTAIDLERQIIPDLITLPGVVAGVLANLATGRVPWVDSVIGILVGGGVFFVIIVVSGGGMGGGDMKLGAMLGAYLGWQVTLFAIFLAVIVGGAVAVGLLATGVRGRKDPVPFGPFLATGGAAGLFWGERVVAWYFSAFPK